MIREVHVYGMAARVGIKARQPSTMGWDGRWWSVRAILLGTRAMRAST